MGLNQDLMKGRSKNVRIFGGAPENDEIINGKIWGPNLKQKGSGDFSSVFWLIPKEWNIFIAP